MHTLFNADLLLQIFFALFPVIAFYIGYRDGKETNRTHPAIFVSCVLSMTCCMYFGLQYDNVWILDMRLIPFVIGLLYGGWRGALLLCVAYFGLRYAIVGGGANYVTFLIPNVLLIAFTLRYARQYQQAKFRDKVFIMSFILSVVTFLAVFRVGLQFYVHPESFTVESMQTIGLFILASLIAGAAIIFLIENVIEKHRLIASLQRFSDSVPLSVYAVNREGIITSVNQSFLEEYPELGSPTVIGHHFSIVSDVYGVDYRATRLYRALAGEETRNAVVDYPKHTLLVNTYPILNPATGHTEGAMSISRNITDVRELRAKIDNLDRLSLVGQMAASVAHEIRNPMTSIRGFVQLMSEHNRGTEHPHSGYYPIILEELDRVNGIIEDFLSLSRNRVVNKQPANLNLLIEDALPLLWAEANMKGIEIKVEPASDMPELQLDIKEIKQLLLNLTRNAFDAMEKDGTLTLRTEMEKDTVRLLVSDTGSGMSSETLGKLFEPFFTTKTKGTGLGLTACKNIIDRHSGRLDIASQQGVGTTFTVVLPLA